MMLTGVIALIALVAVGFGYRSAKNYEPGPAPVVERAKKRNPLLEMLTKPVGGDAKQKAPTAEKTPKPGKAPKAEKTPKKPKAKKGKDAQAAAPVAPYVPPAPAAFTPPPAHDLLPSVQHYVEPDTATAAATAAPAPYVPPAPPSPALDVPVAPVAAQPVAPAPVPVAPPSNEPYDPSVISDSTGGPVSPFARNIVSANGRISLPDDHDDDMSWSWKSAGSETARPIAETGELLDAPASVPTTEDGLITIPNARPKIAWSQESD